MEVKSEQEVTAELREFIDQLIVPLLVAKMMAETEGLYSEEVRSYDIEAPKAA
jgi:hypothetical protein